MLGILDSVSQGAATESTNLATESTSQRKSQQNDSRSCRQDGHSYRLSKVQEFLLLTWMLSTLTGVRVFQRYRSCHCYSSWPKRCQCTRQLCQWPKQRSGRASCEHGQRSWGKSLCGSGRRIQIGGQRSYGAECPGAFWTQEEDRHPCPQCCDMGQVWSGGPYGWTLRSHRRCQRQRQGVPDPQIHCHCSVEKLQWAWPHIEARSNWARITQANMTILSRRRLLNESSLAAHCSERSDRADFLYTSETRSCLDLSLLRIQGLTWGFRTCLGCGARSEVRHHGQLR